MKVNSCFFKLCWVYLNWLKMSNVGKFPFKILWSFNVCTPGPHIMTELFATQSPTFKSEDVIPWCFHSNETSLADNVFH